MNAFREGMRELGYAEGQRLLSRRATPTAKPN
jgi:hypothetical protein